jgi:hypothetical protein
MTLPQYLWSVKNGYKKPIDGSKSKRPACVCWSGKSTGATANNVDTTDMTIEPMIPIHFDHVHPFEWWFLVASAAAVGISAYLFTLKLGDLLRVKRERKNGPILYMAGDKIRHQGFTLALSAGMLMLAVSAVNNNTEPSPQTLNFLVGSALTGIGIFIDGLFTLRRRRRLAELIDEHHPPTLGRRVTDKV